MKRIIFPACSFQILILLAACAGANAGNSVDRQEDLITREEIAALDVSNLHDVVQRLRPRWLTVRGTQSFGIGAQTNSVVVYQGQTRLGGVDALRQLAPDGAEYLEYLDGPTASATLPGLGSLHVEGAIVIHTRPRP